MTKTAALPVYRISHDSAAIVLKNTDPDTVRTKVYALQEHLKKPFNFGELQLHGDIYPGLVVLDRGSDPEGHYIDRLRYAISEIAAKKQTALEFIGSETDTRIRENIKVLGELSQALEEGQLEMYYQPKVDIQTGNICGAEALIRWNHPKHGHLSPEQFIPRAEESTLIDQITYFALDQALTQLALWQKQGFTDMQMAVNISTRNLMAPNFISKVTDLLKQHHVDGKNLELEITESTFIEYVENSIEKLVGLSNASIVLSIDDFGTGYSSLQYLAKLPVSVIKIDQSFIARLPQDTGSMLIVESTINLAHRMGMKVVAEGVETATALETLKTLGCDILQGYFASAPVTGEEFDRLYIESKGHIINSYTGNTA